MPVTLKVFRVRFIVLASAVLALGSIALAGMDNGWADKMAGSRERFSRTAEHDFFTVPVDEAIIIDNDQSARKEKDGVMLIKEGARARWSFKPKEGGKWHLFMVGDSNWVKASELSLAGQKVGLPELDKLVKIGGEFDLAAETNQLEVTFLRKYRPTSHQKITHIIFSKDKDFDRTLCHTGIKKIDDTLFQNMIQRIWAEHPMECDWFLQDNKVNRGWGKAEGLDARGDFAEYFRKDRDNSLEVKLLESVAKETGDKPQAAYPAGDRQCLEEYLRLCWKRRTARLRQLLDKTDKVVYATHHKMGRIYLATETQECPDGSELRIIDLSPVAKGEAPKDELLFDSQNGIVRDPEISFDAKRLLFAWRKTNKFKATLGCMAPPEGNYKIYEMDLATRQIRPLTTDETYGADFEPCYLPNGDIIFSSSRIVQEVTCGWGDCSNLFIMDKDGNYARRIGFDQTHTAFPHLLDDGRVVYTRRDYNDRGQTYSHALFVMNQDGTKQMEYYGNHTCEPTSFQHTRPIPGTGKAISIAGGYHCPQGGKLCVIDVNKGRQDYKGITFINWDHTKKVTSGDRYGREGEQYAYPVPIDNEHLLVAYDPIGGYRSDEKGRLAPQEENCKNFFPDHYGLYFMGLDGRRELLARHKTLTSIQAVPVMTRKFPITRGNTVDYKKTTGTYYAQNVYYGRSTTGLEPGSIKKMRVVRLFYKPVSIGGADWKPPSEESGPGKKYSSFGRHSLTPVGLGAAGYEAKEIVGEADVHEDGSVFFEAPARVPLYFQLIDKDGHVAQTMRSWTTLMPNENFSCVGCHEDKDSPPLINAPRSIALQNNAQKLHAFAGVSARPFSYAKMVQPIWNKHCVACHAPGKKAATIDLTDAVVLDLPGDKTFDSTRRKFYQSYVTLLKAERNRGGNDKRLGPGTPNEWVNYWTKFLTVELIPPYYAGSCKSELIKMLKNKHGKCELTSDEINTVSAWIDLNVPFVGEYDEMNDWDQRELDYYGRKTAERKRNELIEAKNIQGYIQNGQP